MAKYVSRRATLLGFFDDPEDQSLASGFSETCIAVKASEDNYVFQPSDVNPLLALAVARIDRKAVLSMTSEVIPTIIDSIQPDQTQFYIEATGTPISIVASLEEIRPDVAANSKACIVLKERVMLVWSNNPKKIVNQAHDVETQLFNVVNISSLTPH